MSSLYRYSVTIKCLYFNIGKGDTTNKAILYYEKATVGSDK